MADVISFGNFSTMQELIAEGNAMVSGMTAAEAEAALGATANSGLYVYNATTAAGAGNVINFPNAANAAEAAAEYLAGGGTTAASGAATAATGAEVQAVNMAIGQTAGAQAATGVYGLLSMPLPAAAAALAPVAGVALGVGLYELNPSLWEKISRTLLPFCYDDGETMPVTVDEQGNTYYPKAAIDALQRMFEEEGIGGDPQQGTIIGASTPVLGSIGGISSGDHNSQRSYVFKYPVICTPSGTGAPYVHYASTNPDDFPFYMDMTETGDSPVTERYNYSATDLWIAGVHLYVCTGTPSQRWTPGIWQSGGRCDLTTEELHEALFRYATNGIKMGGDYPEGTSQWGGNAYPTNPNGVNILSGYDGQGNPQYSPYYPVSTPIGDPGVSNNPSTNPDPTANPNPAPAIDPYISPVPDPSRYPTPVPVPDPAPVPNPVPNPQPVPDPDRDPSRDPDPDEVPDDPKDPSGGRDGGDSTPPVIPIVPVTPASGASLLHVYNPTQSQIDAFGSWLWTTWSDASIWQTIQKLFNDPMDGIIGLHELYATPSLNGSGTIRCGYMDSGVSSALVGTRYTTINCGTIVVEEYYQNYLDYSPYTQVYVYLPFIGIMPLSADDIIGNAVNIKYHVDSYTGCCIAVITVARSGYSSTVYQFEGNCAVEIPITSGYQSALMSGLLAVAGTAISGNPSVGLTAAHVGRAGLGKNAVQHSGSFGSSYGAMGAKIPYIIVRRPVQKKVLNYSLSYGYPAHKMVYVGNCTGYLRVREVRVMSTTATNVEKEMIVNALKEGVYVK